jgi:hypothetical protein
MNKITYIIGSAKHDKYCDKRGGMYGVPLTSITIDEDNKEHVKLLDTLLNLKDDKGCRYQIDME